MIDNFGVNSNSSVVRIASSLTPVGVPVGDKALILVDEADACILEKAVVFNKST